MAKRDESYNADAITILEGLEAVRRRPGMYIGSVSAKGLNHLVYEGGYSLWRGIEPFMEGNSCPGVEEGKLIGQHGLVACLEGFVVGLTELVPGDAVLGERRESIFYLGRVAQGG